MTVQINFKGSYQLYQPNNAQQQSPVKFLLGSKNAENPLEAMNNYGKVIAFKGKFNTIKAEKTHMTNNNVARTLAALRQEMKKNGLDALIVASTDEYLNETVDKNQSQRIYVSNFTGSAGDIIITQDKAILMVDSRYHTQAGKQVDPSLYSVEKIGLDEDGNKISEFPYQRMIKVLTELAKDKPVTVGFDDNKFTPGFIEYIQKGVKENKVEVQLQPTEENLVDKVRGGRPAARVSPLTVISDRLTGEPTAKKLQRLSARLKKEDANAMVITDLVDIAYLTNLRGSDIDFSSVFKARAFFDNGKLTVFCPPQKVTSGVKKALKGIVDFKPEEEFIDHVIKELKETNRDLKVAYSTKSTSYAIAKALHSHADEDDSIIKLKENPIALMRSIKNPVELNSMQDAMNRADRAVADVINWVNERVIQGKKVTEVDLETQTEQAHRNHGATGLSFKTIPGCGPNAAIVHYSDGNPNVVIKPGDLLLLDTGGYYEAGYATDLTRSWLAGGKKAAEALDAMDPQDLKNKKQVYSIVLKGALQGLFAELPPEATGQDLDRIVRQTMTQFTDPITHKPADFGHSTGHGVGIAVHESPPAITPTKSGEKQLKPGMVFSIEPGLYLENWGGIRFENLVTVVPHHEKEKAKKGWHEIKCLTFCPLDHNLLDPSILDEHDFALIEKYDRMVNDNLKKKD